MRKLQNILVGIICLMMVMPTMTMASTVPESYKRVNIDSHKVPKFDAGKKAELTIPLINRGGYEATNIIVTVVRNKDINVYPFEAPTTAECQEYGPLKERDGKGENKFPFTVRKDAKTGRYEIEFDIEYTLNNIPGETNPVDVKIRSSVLVDVKGTEAKPTNTPKPNKKEEQEQENQGSIGGGEDEDYGDDGGGYGGGSAGDGGDGEGDDKKLGTPRVIVEGFRTEPKVVNAGASFKLIMDIRNTSKKTAVSNMEINLQASGAGDDVGEDGGTGTASDTFLPDKGSNTLFVDSIAADSTTEVSIDLTARADLQQQPYAVGIAMKYEDSKAEQHDASSEISIPVHQKARFELSQVEVSPENIEVGGEGNVVFSIYNLGRTKLHNVKVELVSDTIGEGEAFIGNLEAGSTGEVDLMVTGLAETTDNGEVKIKITYEDKDGNAETYEDKCTIFVVPHIEQEEMQFDEDMMMPEDGQGGGLGTPAKIGIGAAVTAALAAGAFGIIKHKRKKEEDFTDEFLGSDKDEQQ